MIRKTLLGLALAGVLAAIGSPASAQSMQSVCGTLSASKPADAALIEDCKKGASIDDAIGMLREVAGVAKTVLDSSPDAAAMLEKMLDEHAKQK